jgi:hypothetical protein
MHREVTIYIGAPICGLIGIKMEILGNKEEAGHSRWARPIRYGIRQEMKLVW